VIFLIELDHVKSDLAPETGRALIEQNGGAASLLSRGAAAEPRHGRRGLLPNGNDREASALSRRERAPLENDSGWATAPKPVVTSTPRMSPEGANDAMLHSAEERVESRTAKTQVPSERPLLPPKSHLAL